jgi:curli biogenesis system outer membrane secretion channel CsgG
MTRMATPLLVAFCAACATPVQQVPVEAPTPTPPATAQQAPTQPVLDPVGVYDFSTDVQGTAVTGVLTIRRADDGRLAGAVSTDMTGKCRCSR